MIGYCFVHVSQVPMEAQELQIPGAGDTRGFELPDMHAGD